MAPETLDSPDTGLRPLIATLLAQNSELLTRIDTLLARIAELEARAGQPKPPQKTPTNSSLPPSTAKKPNVSGTPAEKKRRKGRPGVARTLAPEPDATRDIYAGTCCCGAALSHADQPHTHAYDYIDLPPVKPVTTRIHLHKGHCPACKKRVAAKPPADMPPGTPFGPGIVGTVTYLHACQMVSYSRLTEVMDGLFGLKLSEGAIANMLARAAKPFAADADKIAETVRTSPVIASDETSARVCGKNHWQWVFGATTAVYHTIAPTRGKAVATGFLAGAKPDVWLSDRYVGQGRLGLAHQYCLAHLIRDAQYAVDAGDTIFAPGFKAFLQAACAIGKKRPELSDAAIEGHARDLKGELDRLLNLAPPHAEGRHLRDSMIADGRDKLLVFLTRRDIEPTNNSSERELRSSVIFRKVTNGFRSGWGAKVYADIRSIVATGRLSGRSPLQSLRATLA